MLFTKDKSESQRGGMSGSNRFLSVFESTPASAPVNTETEKAPGFFDSLLFALTGPDDASLTPEQLRARNGRRAEAAQMAAEYKNPGRRWMQPVSGGGGSGLESIGKIVSLFSGGGG